MYRRWSRRHCWSSWWSTWSCRNMRSCWTMGRCRTMGRCWNRFWRTCFTAICDVHSYIFHSTYIFACSIIRYVVAGSCIVAIAQVFSGVVCNIVTFIGLCLTDYNLTTGKILDFNIAFLNGSVQDKCTWIRDWSIQCMCLKTLDNVSSC